jgi:hypothetical protein
VLRLPLGAGEVEESELLVRLHELGTMDVSATLFSLFRGPFS